LSTLEAKKVLDDLARFGVPVVLFSGGEPLTRPDLAELLEYAAGRGLGTVVSTNGTLITAKSAASISKAGVSYVGISLDGIGAVNDEFRGVTGAFDRAVLGIRNCRDRGVRVGLRLTLTRRNFERLDELFDFIESEGLERACFYHLVPTGRGRAIPQEMLSHAQSRSAIEAIIKRTEGIAARRATDILTVDNHVDGVYIYLKLREECPVRADEVRRLISKNGGGLSSSGVGIGCIDYDGKVHPDQFWLHGSLGDVRQRPFSEIWSDPADTLLAGLRDRRSRIKGRCRLCRYFDCCGGGLRVRADLYFGDPWAPEPACYLYDSEIGLGEEERRELQRCGELFEMPS
jgi:radical SAM protein with 4Fe4S-binding SPASM domain